MAQRKQVTPDEDLLTIVQAAKRLGMSKQVFYRILHEKALPVIHLQGRGTRPITRIDPVALQKYIDDHTTPALRRPA